jgi:hypothetical protein
LPAATPDKHPEGESSPGDESEEPDGRKKGHGLGEGDCTLEGGAGARRGASSFCAGAMGGGFDWRSWVCLTRRRGLEWDFGLEMRVNGFVWKYSDGVMARFGRVWHARVWARGEWEKELRTVTSGTSAHFL